MFCSAAWQRYSEDQRASPSRASRLTQPAVLRSVAVEHAHRNMSVTTRHAWSPPSTRGTICSAPCSHDLHAHAARSRCALTLHAARCALRTRRLGGGGRKSGALPACVNMPGGTARPRNHVVLCSCPCSMDARIMHRSKRLFEGISIQGNARVGRKEGSVNRAQRVLGCLGCAPKQRSSVQLHSSLPLHSSSHPLIPLFFLHHPFSPPSPSPPPPSVPPGPSESDTCLARSALV